MKRKICFITGSRAEYGLLRSLILRSSKSKNINTQIIVTGSHLSKDFGLTLIEIELEAIMCFFYLIKYRIKKPGF